MWYGVETPLYQPIRFHNWYCVNERANGLENFPDKCNLQDVKAVGHLKWRNCVLVSPPCGMDIYWPEIVNQKLTWKKKTPQFQICSLL